MKIEILGMGCASCKKLFKQTQDVVKEMGIEAEVEYSDDIKKMADMGLMSSPVLVIDGHPVISGFVPDEKKIEEAIVAHEESKSRKGKNDGGCHCKCGGRCL